MDTIILAGGQTPPELSALAAGNTPQNLASTERALLDINGHPAIAYVLESLRATPGIGRIAVVAPPSTLDVVATLDAAVVRVAAQEKLSQNVLAGTQVFAANAPDSARVLICTCDIPLVTPATWEQLLQGVQARGLEAAYAIVRRETMEAAFPGGRRTYGRLIDGEFTGGNAFVLPLRVVEGLTGLIEAAHRARKNPLSIARLLGFSFVFKAIRRRLSVLDIEHKMSQILKCQAGAVEMKDAAIAFDVDKVDDYHIALRMLKQ